MTDISKANAEIMKLFTKIEKGIEDGVKEGLLESFRSVVEETPVADQDMPHPGNLRNQWKVSLGSLGNEMYTYSGEKSISNIVSKIEKDMKNFGYGQELYFYNNARYGDSKLTTLSAQEQESGMSYVEGVELANWSPKAPQGMLRLGMIYTDQNLQRALQKNLNKIK